jgi:hypothetical protein
MDGMTRGIAVARHVEVQKESVRHAFVFGTPDPTSERLPWLENLGDTVQLFVTKHLSDLCIAGTELP